MPETYPRLPTKYPALTAREQSIWDLRELPLQAIAGQTGLKERTVKRYLWEVRQKVQEIENLKAANA